MPEEQTFDAIVRVAEIRVGNENLASRNQVALLLENFDPTGNILLDFSDVDGLGQAFSHELFCVFARTNPQVKLFCVNVCPKVQEMIDWALAQ